MGAIRLFLALVVVCDHWRLRALNPLSLYTDDIIKFGFNGGYAVMFFYVISGFLITYTLSKNYKRDLAGTLVFYRNRFIRIFALYWPVAILAFWISPTSRPHSPGDILTATFLVGADWSIAFAEFPKPHWAALLDGIPQAWTLGGELTFYLLAPLLVHSWKTAGVLLAVSLAVRGAFVWQLGPMLHAPWTYYFFPSTLCFFLIGVFAGMAMFQLRFINNPWLGLALLAVAFMVMTFGEYRTFDSDRLWISVLCFAAALPGIFELTKHSRFLNLMGDLSYPVYLVHTLAIIYVGGVIRNLTLSTPSMHAAYVSIVVVTGAVIPVAIVARVVEKYVAALLRKAIDLVGAVCIWKKIPDRQPGYVE